jgi:hypothetical protein
MTDASDLLVERFSALADPLDDSDWRDIRRRAGYRRSRAWLALPLAAALVALVVGSAFAYYADVVDFGSAERAPRKSVEFFELFKVEHLDGMNQQAIPGEARRIETMTAAGRREIVYVAPTEAGGHCYLWEGLGGAGCDRLGTTPLGVSWWASRYPKPTSGITVHVSARYVASVELHLADGTVLTPPITWVSSPIDHGFFVYVYTPEQREHERGMTTVIALDENGEVVTEQGRDDVAPNALPPDAITEEKTVGASITTRSGRAVIWEAPNRYEGRCLWVEIRGRIVTNACVPKGYAEANGTGLGVHPTPETVVFWNGADTGVTALELRYADGDRQRVEPQGHYYLVELPAEHLRPGAQLVEVIELDADGRRIPGPFRFVFDDDPSENPCYGVLPLPAGHTCP